MKYFKIKPLFTGFSVIILLTCLTGLNTSVRAITHISIHIDQLIPELELHRDAHDWLLNNLYLELDMSGLKPVLELRIDTSQLPQPFSELESLSVVCAVSVLTADEMFCQKGQVQLFSTIKGLLDYSGYVSFSYSLADHALTLSLNDIEIGKGKLDATFFIRSDDTGSGKWNARLTAKNINYKSIKSFLKHYLKDELKKLDKVSGQFSFTAQLSGQYTPEQLSLADLKLNGRLKNVAYTLGENLGSKLGFDFNLDFTPAGQQQGIKLKIEKLTGEIFQDPVYLLFDGQEIIAANLNYDAAKQLLTVNQASLSHAQLMDFEVQGLSVLTDSIDTRQMKLSLNIEDFSRLDEVYLRNLLEGTDYEGLSIKGSFSLKARQQQDAIEVSSRIDNVSIEYQEQISLQKLHGQVAWNNNDQQKKPVKESRLSWEKIELSGLPAGKTQWLFKTHHNQMSLMRETKLPVFDGALMINHLQVDNFNNDLQLTIDGIIEPVSLRLLSAHFNWPILDGKLAAVIPETYYTNKQLRMGGAMMMQVFDGTIIIKDLFIDEPLMQTARLTANIDLNQLDLQSLTSTYDFGEIQGRIEGKIRKLQMDAWMPVAFDAYLRTPDKDTSKHRISQQAIDNLSSLGGASAILSKTFMSVFETFGYKKLGLSCRLANGICTMNGIEDKGDAYYIVKGGGIPRIDVMGFQHQVDWNILLERLAAIQSANQAVIE